jgi:hypothetical protein
MLTFLLWLLLFILCWPLGALRAEEGAGGQRLDPAQARCALDQRSYNMNFVYTHINELDSIAA